eukprot:461020_1
MTLMNPSSVNVLSNTPIVSLPSLLTTLQQTTEDSSSEQQDSYMVSDLPQNGDNDLDSTDDNQGIELTDYYIPPKMDKNLAQLLHVLKDKFMDLHQSHQQIHNKVNVDNAIFTHIYDYGENSEFVPSTMLSQFDVRKSLLSHLPELNNLITKGSISEQQLDIPDLAKQNGAQKSVDVEELTDIVQNIIQRLDNSKEINESGAQKSVDVEELTDIVQNIIQRLDNSKEINENGET